MASALKLGTESNGGFEDVTISNCAIYDTGYSGIGLMMVDGGVLNRVSISNITMTNVKVPIFVRLGNRARMIPDTEPPGMGGLRNIMISNVQASGADEVGCSITGLPGFPAQNVTLQNIRIRYQGGGTRDDASREIPEKEASYPSGKMFGPLPAYGFFCRHVQNLKLHNLDLECEGEDQRPAIVCDDVQELDLFGLRASVLPAADTVVRLKNVRGALIHGCRPHGEINTFVGVEGSQSSDIALINNDLRRAHSPVTSGDEVPPDAAEELGPGGLDGT
jgi:polygalacturonase